MNQTTITKNLDKYIKQSPRQLDNLLQKNRKEKLAIEHEIERLRNRFFKLDEQDLAIKEAKVIVAQKELDEYYELTEKGKQALNSPIAMTIPFGAPIKMSEIVKQAEQQGLLDERD